MSATATTPVNELSAAVTGYRSVTTFPGLRPLRVCARARVYAHARIGGHTPKAGNQPVTGNRAEPPPVSVTILRHCRCQDCRRWDDTVGQCEARGLVRYVPKADYEPAMQPFWSDLGMIRPEQWHYCADYHGPQISMDVWAWPKATPTAAQVGAGSNISSSRYREPNPDITADTGEPRVNGSLPGSYKEDRTGNSHAPVVCLLRVANTP